MEDFNISHARFLGFKHLSAKNQEEAMQVDVLFGAFKKKLELQEKTNRLTISLESLRIDDEQAPVEGPVDLLETNDP